MKRLDNLVRLNLEAQNSLEELLIKLLRNGRAEEVNESKE
jgi:hypothetical protein